MATENGASTRAREKCFDVKVIEHKRAMRDKVRESEWILEEKRVHDCVVEAKELGIVMTPVPTTCPMCLVDIPITPTARNRNSLDEFISFQDLPENKQIKLKKEYQVRVSYVCSTFPIILNPSVNKTSSRTLLNQCL